MFNAADELLVARFKVLRYDRSGQPIGEWVARPSSWNAEAENRSARVQHLMAESPLEEWLELYGWIPNHHPDDPQTPSPKRPLADNLLVNGWPQIQNLMRDDIFIKLVGRIRAAHPAEAPAAVMARFEASRDTLKLEWLKALPSCFAQMPLTVRRYVDELLSKKVALSGRGCGGDTSGMADGLTPFCSRLHRVQFHRLRVLEGCWLAELPNRREASRAF